MKKLFPLKSPGKADARVVEAVKSEVRKYVQRERRKDLPEGFDLWEFRCAAGADRETASACALKEIGGIIDTVAAAGSPAAYIEIVAVAAVRTPGAEADASPGS